MQRSLLAALAAASALLLAGSSSQAGLYFQPPADMHPVVSWDSSAVVFFRTSSPYVRSQQSGLYVTSPGGRRTRLLPVAVGANFALSRTWRWLADEQEDGIAVLRPDGSERHVIPATHPVTYVSFSPDQSRLVFANPEGLWVANVDGSGLANIWERGEDPEWSPDGKLIVFRVDDIVQTMAPDGSGGKRITEVSTFRTPIHWSTDATQLAFVEKRGNLGAVRLRDMHLADYLTRGVPLAFTWSPDGRRLAYLTAYGLYAVTLATRETRRLSGLRFTGNRAVGPAELSWAPNGRWLVFSANGECEDRVGVYRVDSMGKKAVRISNRCRIQGTSRGDTLSGTELYDLILGRGGNDVLIAVDGGYRGDDLYGGPGDDRLTGGDWNNVLDGGAGNDRLDGGIRDDTLHGGPGRDVLRGGPGKDTIYARDGERDVVDCGTNGPSNPERADTAYVDRRDVVSHCERVLRK